MKVFVCDRCRKEIPDGKKIGYIAARWREKHGGVLIGKNPYELWDLCESCMEKIVLLIDGTIDVELEPPTLEPEEPEEAEQDPEEEDPEETEAVARLAGNPKQKPVNLRELRELVKQGKTAQEIANHFGISVATYYKHRKKAEHLYITGNL